mmetsp:Transcript_105961/g.341876  ORF Transcript_105961/g.341876 Transcript_105961/m.341876 type:complete len:445 (+) Transcript_105961:49-1383(+)
MAGWRHCLHIHAGLAMLLGGQLGTAMASTGWTTLRPNGTSFLAKFCFDFDRHSTAGYFNVTLHTLAHSEVADLRLLLLDDQASSYPDAPGAWDAYSCEEKLAHARWSRPVSKSLTSMEGYGWLLPISEKLRPRWWFVVLLDCSGSGAIISYNVHAWNPLHGWQAEFSHDHYGVLQMCASLLILYCLVGLAQFRAFASHCAHSTDGHPLIQVLHAGIACSSCAMFLFICHYGVFARNGRGVVFLYAMAKCCQAVSKCILFSILLLTSQGNCISRAMNAHDVRRLLRMVTPFFLTCVGLELWGEFADSRKYTTDFVYSTSLGKLLVYGDLLFLALFVVNIRESYTSEQDVDKLRIYRVWGSLCVLWFLVLPSVTVLAHFVAPWVRFLVAMGASSFAHVLMYSVLVVGLWPSAGQSYFVLYETELVCVDDGDSHGSWKPLAGDSVLL